MNNSEIINKFFDKFSSTTIKTLNNALDKDSYRKIELQFESYTDISEIQNLKKDNALYGINYFKSGSEHPFALIIPEEFVSAMSDILMGGNGDNTFKGTLSELEINATSDLLKTIFKNVNTVYNKLCEKEIEFVDKPKLSVKSEKEFDDFFDKIPCDLSVCYNLKFDSNKNYKIFVLLSHKELKQTLSRLGGLFKQNEPVKKGLSLDSMDVDAVADVEIDIQAQLGKAQIPFKYALELATGSIIELDTEENSNIKVFANGVEIAHAEIVAIEDDLGLRITKLISSNERDKFND